MTTAEMLAEVETQIRKDIPRLMELREGCKFHSGYGVETIVCIKGDKEDIFIFKDLFSNIYETNEIPQHYKIIGHDIMLNDVLEWLKNIGFLTECSGLDFGGDSFYREELVYDDNGNFLYKKTTFCEWNLSTPYLKDQSEELLKFLYNIKNKKWNN